MTGFRKRLAQGLVAMSLICAIGVMAFGWVSTRGDVWERVCMVFAVGMFGSLIGALGLVVATYLKLRDELKRLASRPPLSDEEFTALLSDPAAADPELVGRVRALAAQVFRSFGGERFYPDDRLEEDLHLRDLAPFATRDFCATLEESLDLEEDEIRGMMATKQVSSFGDLVLFASFLSAQSKPTGPMTNQELQSPVWDRALDT